MVASPGEAMPWLGETVTAWHCLTVPVSHRGAVNWRGHLQNGEAVRAAPGDPGGPLIVLTSAGFASRAPVAGGRAFKNVSASNIHTCGFTTGGAVYCWRYNLDGALGDGTTTNRTRPVLAKTTGTLDGVSPGGSHSCALRHDGRVLCWGSNQLGQVGDGTNITPRLLPVLVVGSGNYDAIKAGFSHTCGLTVGQVALCWGANEYGQLGRGFYSQKEGFPQGVEPPL
jgi:alpha-tubulin suppressor-like RCC1 family protein